MLASSSSPTDGVSDASQSVVAYSREPVVSVVNPDASGLGVADLPQTFLPEASAVVRRGDVFVATHELPVQTVVITHTGMPGLVTPDVTPDDSSSERSVLADGRQNYVAVNQEFAQFIEARQVVFMVRTCRS